MNLQSSSGIDVSEQSGPKTYYNLETHYDDVATPPAARGAVCKNKTSAPVDPITVLRVEDTEITTATSESAAGPYYNVDTSYDDVATHLAALSTNDVTGQPVNPEIALAETEKQSTASRPMSDMTRYQQLVLIHDQPGIHAIFFSKYQFEIRSCNIMTQGIYLKDEKLYSFSYLP